MARWVAIFDDDQGKDWIRKEHSKAHFDYLALHPEQIRLAGGLRAGPDEWFCGGLWIMDVANREEAVRLVEEDPYFKLGLRRGYRLFVWGRAPIYGEVML